MTIDNSSTTIADSLALCTATEMTTLRPALGQHGLMGESIEAMVSHLSPVVGDAQGYEHLMGVAQATLKEPTRVTWLQGNRFNTWLSAADQGELVFAQLGANDPSFNLRRESTLLLRQRGNRHLFASAFETHGFFDEPTERCSGARGELDEIRTLGHDDTASVIELKGKRLHLIVMVSNRPDVTADSKTEVNFNGSTYRWTGFFDCQCLSPVTS